MTDEQFETIVSLLKDIKSAVENVDSNTGANTFIEDYVRNSAELLKEIKDSK